MIQRIMKKFGYVKVPLTEEEVRLHLESIRKTLISLVYLSNSTHIFNLSNAMAPICELVSKITGVKYYVGSQEIML